MKIMDVHNDLQKHKDDDQDFHEIVHEMFSKIKDNHLFHIQASMTKLETDMNWIKRFFWLIPAATLTLGTGILIALLNYFLK